MAPTYRLGKGPLVASLETYLSDPKNCLQFLKDVHNEPNPRFYDWVVCLEKEDPDNYDHLVKDVFGKARGDVADDAGDERIFIYREGIRAAVMLALGLDPADEDYPQSAEGLQVAPIDVFWGCGQPSNTANVFWSNSPPGTLRVTVILYSSASATSSTLQVSRAVQLGAVTNGAVPGRGGLTFGRLRGVASAPVPGPRQTTTAPIEYTWFRLPDQIGVADGA